MIITEALIFILPAYICNLSALIFGRGKPIDCKKKLRDNQQIFGDGKTIRGTTSGLITGTITGIIIGIFLNNIQYFLTLGLLLSAGALAGDITASFLKRRLKMKRGQMFPFLDQLDFVIGALIFASILTIPEKQIILIILIITPILHILTNIAGYMLKLKKVPW